MKLLKTIFPANYPPHNVLPIKFLLNQKIVVFLFRKFGLGCPQSVRSQAEKFGFLFRDRF
jgi:hypothetical protein